MHNLYFFEIFLQEFKISKISPLIYIALLFNFNSSNETTVTSALSSHNLFTTNLPINPVPPVTKTFLFSKKFVHFYIHIFPMYLSL